MERMGVQQVCHEIVKNLSKNEMGDWRKQDNGYC